MTTPQQRHIVTSPHPYAIAVGRRIRELRVARGMSLRDVANASIRAEIRSIPAIVLGSYERADRAPTIGRLHDIAQLLGVSVTALLPDGDTNGTPHQLHAAMLALGWTPPAASVPEPLPPSFGHTHDDLP